MIPSVSFSSQRALPIAAPSSDFYSLDFSGDFSGGRPVGPAPKFGSAAEVTAFSFSALMLASSWGGVAQLIIQQRRWDRELDGVKKNYKEVPHPEREAFLLALPQQPGFKKNPMLDSWQKMTLRAERARQVREAREELYAQQSAMWAHFSMEAILDFLQRLKRDSVEQPQAFRHPPVVHAWACYMEAMHMVTKAAHQRAITVDQEQDWYRKLDERWRKTPILTRDLLSPGFEGMTSELAELIKKRSRNRTPAELQRIHANIMAELEGDPEFNRRMTSAITAHEAEYDDVEFKPIEDVDDLAPTFDEAELQRREEARLLTEFRAKMDTLSVEDFLGKS